MSDQIFNQNSNYIINNNEIDMREPNADQNNINAVFGIERRVFKFRLDPDSLATNLLQYFENNSLFKRGDLKNNVHFKGIIDKVDDFSNNLIKIIEDVKENLDFLGDRIYEYALANDKKVGSNENTIKNLKQGLIEIHKLIDISNQRINAIEDFKNKTMVSIENTIKEIIQKQDANDIAIKKVEQIEGLLKDNNIKV